MTTTTAVLVKNLTGAALDWAVAHAIGLGTSIYLPNTYPNAIRVTVTGENWHPSTNWAQGGPLLTNEDGRVISVYEDPHWHGGVVGTGRYLACTNISAKNGSTLYGTSQTGAYGETDAEIEGECTHLGSTYLEAAMRCFVQLHMADWVDVPVELLS